MSNKLPMTQYNGVTQNLLSGDTINLVGAPTGVITNGLLSKWNLSSDFLDSSGNNANATLTVAGVTFAAANGTFPGGARNVATFNGTGYLTFPDTNFPTSPGPMTIGGWVYATASYTTWYLLSYGTAAYARSFYLNVGFVQLTWGASSSWGGTANFYVPHSVWHHIVITYDNSNIRIYADGVYASYGTRSGVQIPTTLNNGTIGCLVGGTGKFTGQACDLRVYNRALTPAEVLTWYSFGG